MAQCFEWAVCCSDACGFYSSPRNVAPPPRQLKEHLAAAEARRAAARVVRPTLRLNLPEELQQQPSRLDMCSKCAGSISLVRGWQWGL